MLSNYLHGEKKRALPQNITNLISVLYTRNKMGEIDGSVE